MKAELSPQPDQLVGGKYRLIRVLGRGAMGIVYEAQHTGTGKHVAIKWLHAHIMESRSAVERLMREAQASARVRHSNVVDVYDIEREGDTLFLVMEYLEGEPLSSLLERGGVPFHDLLSLVLQAMRGVAEAHRQGIVHRDIKPDNIFLAYQADRQQPVAKVLDFGISKLEQPTGGLSLTQTGSTLGTPLYMSYEQLSGQRDVDARTDVYAFGVILYEALTGILPYSADNFAELAAKVITTEPLPPRQLRPDIPEALEAIVLWAMKKRREERPANMGELIDALLPFTTPPFDGERVSLSSRVPSAPPAAPAVASSLPPPQASLRLDGAQTGWHSVLERNQRAQREMEDRVTALVAGTMPEYSPKKQRSSNALWMVVGALAMLGTGVFVFERWLQDEPAPVAPPAVAAPEPPPANPQPSHKATPEPAPAASVEEPAPKTPEPEVPDLLQAAPTQVEPTQMMLPEPASEATPAAPTEEAAPAAPARAAAPAPVRAPQRPTARPIGSSPAGGWRPSGSASAPEPPVYIPPPPPPVEPPVVAAPVEPAPPPPAPAPAGATQPNPFDGPDDDNTYRAGRPKEDEF